MTRAPAILLSCLITLGLSLARAEPFLDAAHDPRIPALEDVVGHETGDEITKPQDVIAYMTALAVTAPDRMRLFQYAESWQGRPLFYGVISSAENIARLDEIKQDLSDIGAGTASREVINRTPAVTWLAYGVHGNEISSSDAALALAWHLLAAENDPVVEKILAETIVIIDPMQNPDGRARFVHNFESARGLTPFADRYAAEHDEPWPSGRTNHYLFDMNRDWFALTQPETRGRVAAMQEWQPVVVVDAHEMGGDNSYFFPPAAAPFNPNITGQQQDKQTLIGLNHARWFDRLGFEYFTREVYDAFYPGYGDMWPGLNGAISMTYEQGSARGLKFRKRTGEEFSYRETVEHHFIATLSTAEVVASNKELFLQDYAAYRRKAVTDGRKSRDRFYVFDLSPRRAEAEALARRLVFQGIDVQRLEGERRLCGETYPEGALVVDSAQPNYQLIRTLLDEETSLPAEFMEEQERRRKAGLGWELYDVTAWSLPLMSGVAMATCKNVNLREAVSIAPDQLPAPRLPEEPASFAYAVPWTDAGQAKLVIRALAEGLNGKVTSEGFTAEGRSFPRGTVVFSLAANKEGLGEKLALFAESTGAEIAGLNSSWTESGPNLGSSKFRPLKTPQIAILWDEGVSSLSAGNTRFVLERQLGLPVTPIRTRTVARASLSDYDVLIIPEAGGSLAGRLGNGGAAAIREFTEDGGTVIGFGSALQYLSRENARPPVHQH